MHYWYFSNLLCAVHFDTSCQFVAFIFGKPFVVRRNGHLSLPILSWFPLNVASTFLDLVCLVHVVTISTLVMISSKSGFHISRRSMFSICSNRYNWGNIKFQKVDSTFLYLVCYVYVVTNTTRVSYIFYNFLWKWHPYF